MKKNLIKIASIAMSLMMAASTMAFADATDIKIISAPAEGGAPDWTGTIYEEAVGDLMSAGVISGDVDGQFHGGQTLTRAQACKIIALTMTSAAADFSKYEAKAKSAFTDLNGATWAAGYIGYAVEKGFVNGYGNGKFGPSDNVTLPQLAAMLTRAAGTTVTGGDWAESALSSAIDKLYFHGMGLVADPGSGLVGMANLNIDAEKWMCAMMTFNAKSDLKKAATETTTETKPEAGVQVGSMTFVKNGEFGENLDTFNGIKLAKNANIYTYKSRSDFNDKLELVEKDFNKDTVFKFKNVVTPAFYSVKDGMIVTLVVPGDVGFRGNAFGAITSRVQMSNEDGQSVAAFETIIGGNNIAWLAKKSTADAKLVTQAQIDTAISEGAICQVVLSGGQVTEVNLGAENVSAGVYCNELTAIAGAGAWREVTEIKKDGAVKVSDAAIGIITFDTKTAVYVYDEDDECYKFGDLSDITIGDFIRAYDVYENDKSNDANIVFVMPEKVIRP